MKVASIIVILLILSGWIIVGIRSLWDSRRASGGRRWLEIFAGIFMITGVVGFLGAGLSAMGGLNWLPQSFEWPIGYAKGVVATKDHFFMVPHIPSGRIQVYDRNWKFVRGWHVDANGGSFRLKVADSDRLEVITQRGKLLYTFDTEGQQLSLTTYAPESYSSFVTEGQPYFVPTTPVLLIFSHPIYSWFLAAIGLGLYIVADKIKRKKRGL